MQNFFAQIVVIVARNGEDKESNWMQLLVFLVVAVFWVVSGIIRAKSAKKDLGVGEGKEEPEKTPRRSPQHPTIRPELKIQPSTAKPHKILRAPTKQKIKIPQKELSEISKRSAMPNLDINQSRILQTQESKLGTTKGIINFDDLNELKKAVLYHEILGKPVALRDVQD